MIAGLFKVLLFYMAYVFIKNVVKGYLTYQGLKNNMKQNASFEQKEQQQQRSRSSKKSSQSDVFEAEYRVLNDQK